MSKPFTGADEYHAAVLRLGAEVAADAPPEKVLAAYAALAKVNEEAPYPFARVVTALGLGAPAACCLAWALYTAEQGRPVGAARLLARLRRLGGMGEAQSLTALFVQGGRGLVVHPVAEAFMAERLPPLDNARLMFDDDSPVFFAQGLLDEMRAAAEGWLACPQPRPMALVLRADDGGGRKFLFGRFAAAMECPLLVLEERATPAEVEDALLAAALYGALVCINSRGQWRLPAGRVAGRLGMALVAAPREDQAADGALPAPELLERWVPALDDEAGGRLFTHLLHAVPLEDGINPAAAVAGLGFSPGRLAEAAGRLRAEALALKGAAVPAEVFGRVVRQAARAPVSGARLVETAATLEDLVLPNAQKRQLADLCGYARVRDTVYGRWGFGKKTVYGRGLSALFYGAPGTGKTMAAGVVAAEVGLPLYRVDLAQMLSKYIGETQKNIGRVFDDAERAGCILFFDEADALFARRSEAAETQDKYANAEVAYLLQRTEQHDGICILATNLLQNFDEAFRRRIGYMLHFPMPDAALRERIWRGVFPKSAPVQPLDYAFLARELELSGAGIKACALHAAYDAALNGGEIDMRRVLLAAQGEYAKQGKSLGVQAAQWLAGLGPGTAG